MIPKIKEFISRKEGNKIYKAQRFIFPRLLMQLNGWIGDIDVQIKITKKSIIITREQVKI